MNAAIIVKFGAPKMGREAMAMQVLGESMQLWDRFASEGRCEAAEIFIGSGGGGMTIARGDRAKLSELMFDDDFIAMRMRASSIAEDVQVDLAVTGEGMQHQVELYAKELANMGLM